VKSVNDELYDPMVFWEAEDPALNSQTPCTSGWHGKIKLIDILQNLSKNEKYLEHE